jgi:septum formation protein
MASTPKIILASRSPARRELMKQLGLPFECHASDIFEDMEARKDPVELAIYLAAQKAEHIAAKYADAIIIGVDTFVVIGKEKIGKPENIEGAARILQKMSGQKIEVVTGIAALKTDANSRKIKELISSCSTFLTMKKLSALEIRDHAHRPEALTVAGGITIENDHALFTKIEGDYNNIIGLPIFQLKEMLEQLGVKLA